MRGDLSKVGAELVSALSAIPEHSVDQPRNAVIAVFRIWFSRGRYRPATKVTVVLVDSSARSPCRPTLPHRARVRASPPWSLNSCWHSKSGTAMAARSCRAFARDLFGELGLQRRLAGFRHLRKGFRVIAVRVMETAQNASPRHASSCPSERSATRRARWRTKPPGAGFRLVRPESPSSFPSGDRPPSSKNAAVGPAVGSRLFKSSAHGGP